MAAVLVDDAVLRLARRPTGGTAQLPRHHGLARRDISRSRAFLPTLTGMDSTDPARDAVPAQPANPASAASPVSAVSLPSAAAPAMRASDQDRDRVAAVLGDAMATGRLTSVELAERMELAYTAKTLAELAPLTADLPAVRADAAPASAVESQEVAATFSKVIRRGRWVAGRHTTLRTRFGALIVDLSDAVLPGREITVEIDSLFGKAIVTVPRNARILDEGGALFGKRTVTSGAPESDGDADGPLIRLTGQARFGKIAVHRQGESGFSWYDR